MSAGSMSILILGGTQFVGRHVAQAALDAGHTVTVFNRGESRDDLPAHVERLRGDRDGGADGLAALTGRAWDACVDVSGYTPRQVRPSLELLRSRVGRYVFISAVAVYGDPPKGPVTEDFALVEPAPDDVTELNQEMYGRAKVACEDLCQSLMGDRATILRPQVVAGPRDPIDRYSYWVRRAAQGGTMLAPGDGSDHVQVIDARDAARFVLSVVTRGLSGAFNLSGPRLTWREFLQVVGVDGTRVRWVPTELLRRARATEREVPLFRARGGVRAALMHVSNEKAIRAGLTLTEPAITALDTRRWLESDAASGPAPALTPEREAELLRLTRD